MISGLNWGRAVLLPAALGIVLAAQGISAQLSYFVRADRRGHRHSGAAGAIGRSIRRRHHP